MQIDHDRCGCSVEDISLIYYPNINTEITPLLDLSQG